MLIVYRGLVAVGVVLFLCVSPASAKVRMSRFADSVAGQRLAKLLGVSEPPRPALVLRHPETMQFQDLSDAGWHTFAQIVDAVRWNEGLWNGRNAQAGSFFRTLHSARLGMRHVLLMGEGGANKSRMINTTIESDKAGGRIFEIQCHPDTPATALIGGQIFEAAKRGKFRIEPGGIIKTDVAKIDEIGMAEPEVLVALLGATNHGERSVMLGEQVFSVECESFFSSTNDNLQEIYQNFQPRLGPMFKPLMNRFGHKGYAIDWLPASDFRRVLRWDQEKRDVDALLQDGHNVQSHKLFLKPKPIDWHSLRILRRTLIVVSPELEAAYYWFANAFRSESRKRQLTSQENKGKAPFPYLSTATISTRSAGTLDLEQALDHLFIHLIVSPLGDPRHLQSNFSRPRAPDYLSLWRLMDSWTLVTNGHARVFEDASQPDDSILSVHFGMPLDPEDAGDEREKWNRTYLNEEQVRFNHLYRLLQQEKIQELGIARSLAPTDMELEQADPDDSVEWNLAEYDRRVAESQSQ